MAGVCAFVDRLAHLVELVVEFGEHMLGGVAECAEYGRDHKQDQQQVSDGHDRNFNE